ncbi:MAG TPA: lysyl oxidase family protein [Gaiellaceae bacterium]|nr:lysyl oxidase family protein [Gaiellaceae bacterium]
MITSAEPQQARLLVAAADAIVAVAPDLTRKTVIGDAQDASYSPDGTLIAFARSGDLWLANADGSGTRQLVATPNVVEWGPTWLANGRAIVYTASIAGRKQIRLLTLPTGPTRRIAPSNGEEYGAAISRGGRLAFVSTRDGAPAIYAAQPDGQAVQPFDTAPPVTPVTNPHDLAWSPDGTKLAYDATAADGSSVLVIDDGTTQTDLTAGQTPVWAPTGTRLAVATPTGLGSVALDGTDVRQLGSGQPLDWRVVPTGAPKFPNLVQRPPSGLVVERIGEAWTLGFTSMIDNRGPGILWVRASRPPGSHVMDVRQVVQLTSGSVRVDQSSGELKYVNAFPHHHWHFLGFDHYELRSAGDFKLVVRDHKSGFCIADHYGTAIGVPHGPPRFLGNCAQFHPEARSVVEGASVGYTDKYPAFFHGQQLDITHVRAGNYWLVHVANEDFHLRESDYNDNTASLLIRLTWHEGAPTVTPIRACLRAHC